MDVDMSSTMYTGTCLSSLLSTFLPYAHLVEVLTALSGKTALTQFEVFRFAGLIAVLNAA